MQLDRCTTYNLEIGKVLQAGDNLPPLKDTGMQSTTTKAEWP